MSRMKGGACYNLLDGDTLAIRVKRWLDSIENKTPPIYTDTCKVRYEIADDGLCFYNSLLTALGKNSGGKTQIEVANSQQLARYIAEWLDMNKDTIIPVAGGMLLKDAMPTNKIPQHLIKGNSKATKFSFKEYIRETINFQGIAPNVYPELEVSGWAAANVLNVNIKVFIGNQSTIYSPLSVGVIVPTISLFNTGNHFVLCKPQNGGNYMSKYKTRKRKQGGRKSKAKRKTRQRGGACYNLLEIDESKLIIACHSPGDGSMFYVNHDGTQGKFVSDKMTYVDTEQSYGTKQWKDIPDKSMLYVWGENCPVYQELGIDSSKTAFETSKVKIQQRLNTGKTISDGQLINILDTSYRVLQDGGVVIFPNDKNTLNTYIIDYIKTLDWIKERYTLTVVNSKDYLFNLSYINETREFVIRDTLIIFTKIKRVAGANAPNMRKARR